MLSIPYRILTSINIYGTNAKYFCLSIPYRILTRTRWSRWTWINTEPFNSLSDSHKLGGDDDNDDEWSLSIPYRILTKTYEDCGSYRLGGFQFPIGFSPHFKSITRSWSDSFQFPIGFSRSRVFGRDKLLYQLTFNSLSDSHKHNAALNKLLCQ